MENVHLFMIVFGLVCFYAPFDLRRSLRKKQDRTGRVTGRVVGHEWRRNSTTYHSNHASTQHAVVAFAVEGRDYQCISDTGATWIINPVGQQLEVHYNPLNPSDAGVPEGEWMKSLEKTMVLGFPLIGVYCLGHVAWTYRDAVSAFLAGLGG
ncbi:MAG: DUF3592 domain-containing protein [Puniceicoccaceae bacterium]|nr:MAG: DUF3592 domain-containing protein [Puniceicoccaceae bacterium]